MGDPVMALYRPNRGSNQYIALGFVSNREARKEEPPLMYVIKITWMVALLVVTAGGRVCDIIELSGLTGW